MIVVEELQQNGGVITSVTIPRQTALVLLIVGLEVPFQAIVATMFVIATKIQIPVHLIVAEAQHQIIATEFVEMEKIHPVQETVAPLQVVVHQR